jgi:VanZ family protein
MRKQLMINKKNIMTAITFILFVFSIFTILFFSSRPAEESNKTSMYVTNKIENTIGESYLIRNSVPEEFDFHRAVRKLAHIIEFLFLGVTSCSFFMMAITKKQFSIFVSCCFCILFSIFDESSQRFINGRNPAWFDVRLDILGALLGIFSAAIIFMIYTKVDRVET